MGRNNKGQWMRGAVAASLVAGLLVAAPPQPAAVAVGTGYRDTVLADGPVAYWRLGEASGPVAADEVGTLDGTYEGSPALAQSGLVIDSDTAVRFGGGSDLVHVPDSSLINIGTHTRRTIEAWFNVDDAEPRQVIVEEGGGTRGLNIYVDGGQVFFGGWNTQNDASADTPWGGTFLSASISAGATHHAVLVLDQPSGVMTGYIDGMSVGSGPAGTLHGHASDTGIGAMNDASRFHDSKRGGDSYHFVGVIDEVAFYNSVLTAGDVAAHYAAGVTLAEDPSVSFVTPNDGAVVSGSTAIEVAASDPQDAASALTVDISSDGGATFAAASFNPGPDTHSVNWDTTTGPDGPASLVARVQDTSGNVTTDSITVSVLNNPGSDDYPDAVLADNPVVYYRLGDVGGTTATDEIGNVDGTYVGGPSLGQAGLVNGPDTAVGFDGTNDLIHVPDSALINRGQFAQRSVEAWFAVSDTSSRQVIFEEGAGTRGLSIYVEGGQLFAGAWNLSGQSWGPIFLNAAVSAVEAHHVVAVLGSGSFELFLDGASVGSAGGAGTLFNHSADTGIAAMNDSARFHDGKVAGDGFHLEGVVDEVAIYNAALSAAAVAAHNATGVTAGPQDPTVSFFAPTDGATVAGSVTIEVVASDPQDAAGTLAVEISTDGGVTFTPASFNSGTGRHELAWDTTAVSDGWASLATNVTDADANTGSDSIEVIVNNAAANTPSVVFVDPVDTDVVSGTITIEVVATDPQSSPDVLDVDISTDGGVTFTAASFTAGPDSHSLSWDTTEVSDGPAPLVARVTDPDANSSIEQITVTVANAPPAAYRDAVLASGPDVYWRLDETAGTTALDIVGGLDSAYVGGPQLGVAGLVADNNAAVAFDGVDDLVAVPDSSLINLGTRTQRTISAWFRADDVTSRQVIVDEGGVTRGLSIYVYQGNLYVGAWNPPDDPSSDTPWGPVFFSTPVTAGQVYNAVAVLDQPTASFTAYVNGVPIGTAAAGTLHGHGSDTGIGAMNNATRFHDSSATGNGHHFDGVIDEVAFYNDALDSATVTNLFLIGQALAEDPSVVFHNPQNGNAVSGSIMIEVTAADPQDPAGALDVDISTDGGATFGQATFNGGTLRHTLSWDTTTAPDGTITLVARVTDTDLNESTTAINVTVSNTGATHMIIAAGDISHCNNTNDTDTANLITQIIAGTSLPVTVVPVGDLAYENGSAADFANCYDPTWGQHKAITMPVPGNHEYNTPNAQGYYDYFGAVAAPPDGWYRYELAGWEIYALNSNCGSIGTCGATTPQVQWLRNELAASSNACSLAFTHHPRFTEQNPFSNLEEFWKAMYEFGGDLIVSAHAHYYAHSSLQDWQGNSDPVNGIRQIIAGTGGRSLHSLPGNPHPNQQVVDNTTYGVVVIELSASGYSWQFRRVGDGAILYSGSDTCH